MMMVTVITCPDKKNHNSSVPKNLKKKLLPCPDQGKQGTWTFSYLNPYLDHVKP